MTLTDDDLLDILGPVGFGEYQAAEDWAKPQLREWAARLPNLDDIEFLTVAESAIYESALVQRFRMNFEHEHCKATACYREAKRRHEAAGHADDCSGDTIYSRAYANVMRSQGHTPPDPKHCTCGTTS